MCASNVAAIEIANRAAGSPSVPTVRLTSRSLIMADLPGWALGVSSIWCCDSHSPFHFGVMPRQSGASSNPETRISRSEEHTSELQSHLNLVCRLLLEKKKQPTIHIDCCRWHLAQMKSWAMAATGTGSHSVGCNLWVLRHQLRVSSADVSTYM